MLRRRRSKLDKYLFRIPHIRYIVGLRWWSGCSHRNVQLPRCSLTELSLLAPSRVLWYMYASLSCQFSWRSSLHQEYMSINGKYWTSIYCNECDFWKHRFWYLLSTCHSLREPQFDLLESWFWWASDGLQSICISWLSSWCTCDST